MNQHSLAAIAVLALASCGQPAEGNAAAQDASSSAASQISEENISATRTRPVDDQFIECTNAEPNGITTRQFFVIIGGAVKSYSEMQNYARNMCDPGQPGCALGWHGEKVGLYFQTNSGAINQIILDLETLEMDKVLTTTSRDIEQSTSFCQRQPLPEGIVID